MATKGKSSRPAVEAGQEQVQNKILLDELIPVMSLLDYPLNLLPQASVNGRAKYRFDKFGQRKEILYQDILTILEMYSSFMESGYFIILDKRVIDRHGLQEVQSKVLTKENIDKILDGSKEALDLYKQGTPEQQNVIIGMLTQKLVESPDSVDMNIIHEITRYSKVNIVQNAEESKALFEKKEAVK